MKLFSQPKTTLLACLLGGLSTFAMGCVITLGNDSDAGAPEECGDLLTNSYQDGNECFCEVGYEWCTADPKDYDCCKATPKPADNCTEPNNELIDDECFCAAGYKFCSEDPTDYSCCESNQGESTSDSEGTSGTTSESDGSTTVSETGEMMCMDLQDPPESCDPDTELAYCTTTDESCIGESEYYTCQGGAWVLTDGDADCLFDGVYDFSYGCIDDGVKIDQVCGVGPGTPCVNSDPDSCSDDDTLNYCTYGKLGALSCLTQCTEIGDDMGNTYDFGSCGEQEGAFKCLCCDFDDPGCGDAGTSSSSGGGSSSSTGG